jgi:hypothetical protein
VGGGRSVGGCVCGARERDVGTWVGIAGSSLLKDF